VLSCSASFFVHDTPPPYTYTLSLHDALPIYDGGHRHPLGDDRFIGDRDDHHAPAGLRQWRDTEAGAAPARCSQPRDRAGAKAGRSEEHTSELQSLTNLVCRLLLEKKKTNIKD